MEMAWWERDEVNLVAATLDGTSLGSFAICCKAVHTNLRSVDTLRWLTSLRGLDPRAGICSIAHIEIAEAMAACSSSIHFGWGSMSVVSSAFPSLRKLAVLLQKHTSLTLSIEAHCGLEARYAMPLPGQAREFTRNRAEAVKEALEEQAAKANVPLDEERVVVRAWGCSRPMVWCFGQKGMDEPYDLVGAAKNRRVELYLRSSGFEVPRRRLRSEIPRPPGEPPLEDMPATAPAGAQDAAGPSSSSSAAAAGGSATAAASGLKLDDDDNDGTADATLAPDAMVTVQLPNGQVMSLTASMLHQMIHQHDNDDDDDDDDDDEATPLGSDAEDTDEEGGEEEEGQEEHEEEDVEEGIGVGLEQEQEEEAGEEEQEEAQAGGSPVRESAVLP